MVFSIGVYRMKKDLSVFSEGSLGEKRKGSALV